MDIVRSLVIYLPLVIIMLLCILQLIQYFYQYHFIENILAKLNYICCFLIKLTYILFAFQINYNINANVIMALATTVGILNLAFVIRICHRLLKTISLDKYIMWVFCISLPIALIFFITISFYRDSIVSTVLIIIIWALLLLLAIFYAIRVNIKLREVNQNDESKQKPLIKKITVICILNPISFAYYTFYDNIATVTIIIF